MARAKAADPNTSGMLLMCPHCGDILIVWRVSPGGGVSSKAGDVRRCGTCSRTFVVIGNDSDGYRLSGETMVTR